MISQLQGIKQGRIHAGFLFPVLHGEFLLFNLLVKDSILFFPPFVQNSRAFKKNKSGGKTAKLPVFINSALEAISAAANLKPHLLYPIIL